MSVALHVTECFSTGVSRAIRAAVAALPEWEHHLLACGDDDPSRDGFVTVEQLPMGAARRIAVVNRRVRSLRPDLVHAHSSWAGVYARAAALPVPVIYQPHGYRVNDPDLPRAPRLAVMGAERLLGRNTDMVLALSQQEMRWARKLSPGAKAVMVPNAPTLPDCPDGADDEREPVVVMSGRVSVQKDPAFFAALAERVGKQRGDVKFRWLGGRDDEPLARTLSRAGVVVTGWLSSEAIARELRHAAVYMHTATYEGFPLSVLDALACRTPVVVRDIAAFDGVGLVQVSTVEQAASAVFDILDGGPLLAQTRQRGEQVLASMNAGAQQRALQEAYRWAIVHG